MYNKKYEKKVSNKLTLFVVVDKKEYYIFKDEEIIHEKKKIRYVDNVRMNGIVVKFKHFDSAIEYIEDACRPRIKRFRLTKNQDNAIKKMAKDSGMGIQEWIKKIVLDENISACSSEFNTSRAIILSEDEVIRIEKLMNECNIRSFSDYVRSKMFQ